MRWSRFRRSQNVEDYTNSDKPVDNSPWWVCTINDVIALCASKLAKDAGRDDIKGDKKDEV